MTIHIYQSIRFIKDLEEVDNNKLASKMIDLPWKKKGFNKTIVFDLDETLAHCVRNQDKKRKADVYLPIKMPNGRTAEVGFNIRPFCKECLETANKFYEVVVFTASHKWYADVILDYLDPTKELI